jgi:hypothetical protein
VQRTRQGWPSARRDAGLSRTGRAWSDRIAEYGEIIAHDGPVVATKHGPKEHPLLKIELANRSFVVRTLARLGLNMEPVKGMGRPGWKMP